MVMRRRAAGGALLLSALCLVERTKVAAAAGPRAVTLVTAFTAAWDAGDVESLLGLFTSGAETRVATPPDTLVIIAGVARLRTWLRGLPTFRPRTWGELVELPDGRIRWTAQFFGNTEESDQEPVPTSLLLEAALAPEGRISTLCVSTSEAGLVAAWSGTARSTSQAAPAGQARVAPVTTYSGPVIRTGPGEGDYRPVAIGGLLAAGALLLTRRRGR